MPFRDLEMETGLQGESGTELLNAGILNVKDFGAIGDGAHDDSSALSSAILSANGQVLIMPSGTYRIANDVTVSTGTNIWFANGAKISVDSDKKLTIDGKLTAGLHQIFTGLGSTAISRGSCEKVIPQWWGAVGDGTTDDTSAIQSAIDCAETTTSPMKVYIPNGTYKITTALDIRNSGIEFYGDGKNQTRILASGGINGINITESASNVYLEAVNLHDFRIYTDTDDTGVGIEVDGMRHTTIDNVWVGGWYNSAVGFNKGIYCHTNPAYYLTIKRCILMHNTCGIYLTAGANDTRIDKNDVWYGDYSIYIDGGDAVRVTNNTLEYFDNYAIYLKDHICAYVTGNYIEHNGVKSIYLTGTTKRAIIFGNTSASQVYTEDEIVDVSDNPDTNQIENYHIPIRLNTHTTRDGRGGVIDLDRTPLNDGTIAYAGDQLANNITMRAIKGDWVWTNDYPSNAVEIQTKLNAKNISTPYAGTGGKYGNLIPNSEDFSAWTYGGTITVTTDCAVAPDGTLTADRIYGNDYSISTSAFAVSASEVVNYSVWLKSDFENTAYIAVYSNSTSKTLNVRYLKLTPYWKRYNVMAITRAGETSVSCSIVASTSGYSTIYAWGAQANTYSATSATDDWGSDGRSFVYDGGADFRAVGIDVGGKIQKGDNSVSTPPKGVIAYINSVIAYNTGSTAEPSVGDTVTGGTSGATGIVVANTIDSGDFATNDAVGRLEINITKGTFSAAETISYTGGSIAQTAWYPNSIIRWTSVGDFTIDNGDVVYLSNSATFIPSAYCPTYGTSITQETADFGAETIGTKNVVYNANPIADVGVGDKARFTAGTNLVFGDVCYMGSDGKMEKAIATGVATSQVMAICLETIAENSTGLFLLKGFIHLHTIAPSFTVGAVVYLSDTSAGGYDVTAPADTDECIIKLGIATVADVLYFNPDSTIVEHN